jgi:hypothetical protein
MNKPALSWGNSHLASLRVLVASVLAVYLAIMLYYNAWSLLTTDWRLIAELGPSLLALLMSLLQILSVILLIIFYLRRHIHILLYVGACFVQAAPSLLFLTMFWSWPWLWHYLFIIAAKLIYAILYIVIAIIALQERHEPRTVRFLAIALVISSVVGSIYRSSNTSLLGLILPLAVSVFLFGRNQAKIDEPGSMKEDQS